MAQRSFLAERVQHIDVKKFNAVPLIEQYEKMSFQARNLARAARIIDSMIKDTDCSVILCLAGSLFSAGLKKIVHDMIGMNIVDIIVSTGANIVDQDFFEALGFNHFKGDPDADDRELMKNGVDRIYDTFISEENLRVCDMTIAQIADSLPPKPYSSREFIREMGRYLEEKQCKVESVVLEAYRKGVPIFVPAFSDCSAGFGLVYHQWNKKDSPTVSIDSAKDFLELTKIKVKSGATGLFMIGGGTPKNFAQDVTVSAEIVGDETKLHKYAVQITVADERDGGLSGSTLKEAHSWGKVDASQEQMVFAEATLALPLIASYIYHTGSWKVRTAKNFTKLLDG